MQRMREANFKVATLCSSKSGRGHTQAIMSVRQLPPRESCANQHCARVSAGGGRAGRAGENSFDGGGSDRCTDRPNLGILYEHVGGCEVDSGEQVI